MAKIFVSGGAGYIGSHTVMTLLGAGEQVVVFDNLSSGHREALPGGVPLVRADLADEAAIRAALEAHRPDAVIHFAASIEAGESMLDPRRFYRNNVVNGLNLLNALLDTQGDKLPPLLFSSSAAVYGQPERVPIREDFPRAPVNVYGQTKLDLEHALAAYRRAYGLRSTSLRYFNASGAAPDGRIGEAHPNKSHLIELALLTALGQRRSMKVFGTDYPTPDGTCIRDYIHVLDLASAHLLAVRALLAGQEGEAYNVGVGHGFSVKEVLDACDRAVGRPIPREYVERRPGDPAALVADSTRIREALGWRPEWTELDPIVESAWRWHSSHPNGFSSPG